MAFHSESYNDKDKIKKSRPSLLGKLWQKTALRIFFAAASLGFLAVQEPSWWYFARTVDKTSHDQPEATIPDSRTTFSGTVHMAVLRHQPHDRRKDEAITSYIRSHLEVGKPLEQLPEALALKFQFRHVNLRTVATAKGYDVHLKVAPFRPIAKILGSPLLLSTSSAIYPSSDAEAFDALPKLHVPLSDRWTARKTLEVTKPQQHNIDAAMRLMKTLANKKMSYNRIILKPHRGFQVLTPTGLYLQFGYGQFDKSIKRYEKILKREDFAIAKVKEIHLDFKGKALITMKPKADQ